MMLMTLIPLIAFSFTTVSFLFNNSHFLLSLLCLEGMMLSLVLYIPSNMNYMLMYIPSTALILLTFGACEASLGLSIMVKLSRHYGSDMMSSLSINKC